MKCSNRNLLISIIILILAVSPAQSQCPPVYTFTGDEEGDLLGFSVASAGDVNNDGYDDFIIGAPKAGGLYNPGRAYVFSGLTGDTLYVFIGETDFDSFGISVSEAGDVNNDGFGDVIIGANTYGFGGVFPGKAYIFSGKTGSTLYEFTGEADGDRFGSSVASAGDVNYDGFDDIIVGAWRNDGGSIEVGRAYVFSGQTGDTLYVFTGEGPFDNFGRSVASAGDVNNDGFDDLIVGAYRNDAGGENAGRAYVFSGLNGDTIHVFTGEASFDAFGYSVASAGDLNNDGFDDLIVGAYLSSASGPKAGRVYVFSGQTGDTIYVFSGETHSDGFGYSVASAGDVNNDSISDVIVGAIGNEAGGIFYREGVCLFWAKW